MSVILNHLGTPEPPSDIVRRLRQVDPDLGLRFVPFVTGDLWAITLRWPEKDPRREDIQKGLRDPRFDWDAICYLPIDCPPDQAFGYLQRGLVSANTDRARWLAEHSQAYNSTLADRAFDSVMEEAIDGLEKRGSRLFDGMGGERVAKISVPETVK